MAFRATFSAVCPYFSLFQITAVCTKKTGQKKDLDIFEKERYHVDRLVRVNVQIIIVYLFAQKTFIAGLTSGSVKG